MEPAAERFTEKARRQMREAIAAADGNEVFFVGTPEPDRQNSVVLIDEVEVVARGNEYSVPAVLAQATAGTAVIHNHPGGNLTPSDPDLNIAANGAEAGIGFIIIDNEADQAYVVIEIPRPRSLSALDIADLTGDFAAGGRLSQTLPGYEDRPSQIDMVRAVADSFNRGRIAAIEAGTGTGKTLAYLLPAARWAVTNRERVVISTRTINLQEQLIHKDIPFLKAHFGEKFEAALIKGAGNYICLRRLSEISFENDLLADNEEKEQLAEIAAWAKTTEDGSSSDLSFVPPHGVWERVCAEPDFCMRLRCRRYQECYYQKSRRQAAASNVLVVNHALLMSDLAVRVASGNFKAPAVLPPYNRIIIDEAHNLEEAATSHFAISATRRGARATCGRLFHFSHRKKKVERGLLPLARQLVHRERKLLGDDRADRLLRDLGSVVLPRLIALADNTDAFFLRLADMVTTGERDRNESKLRLTRQTKSAIIWRDELAPQAAQLKQATEGFTEDLLKFRVGITKGLTNPHERFESLCWQLDAVAGRLATLAGCYSEMQVDSNDRVRWLETSKLRNGEKTVRFVSAPVDPAPLLCDALYRPFKTVVLTSATLAVDESFKFFSRGVGLDLMEPERVDTMQLPSPFDYAGQVLLGCAGDLPGPDSPAWRDSLADTIGELLQITGGRAFVLTTSSYLVRYLHDRLSGQLAEQGINSIHQFSAARHKVIERFKLSSPAVLFATDSFWQGVDVIGDALECVILTRLPFAVPTEPLMEAKLEYLQSKGLSRFNDYQLPSAVLKLKQGFGRLIRHRTDRGAVIVLDPRLLTKGYGKKFLRSLPRCQEHLTSYDQLKTGLRQFF
jgi:ATP-dependent DNA helicase DinG